MTNLELDEYIIKLANQGLRVVDIAQRLKLSKTNAATRVSALIKAGRLQRAVHRKGSAQDHHKRVRFLSQRYKVNVGNIGHALDQLTMEETQWLYEQVPVGMTISEYLMTLVRDSYAEDKE